MTDGTRMLVGAAAGALVGSLAAYVVFTGRGRYLLSQINPTLDELAVALEELRRAIRKAADVAEEARGVLEDARAAFSGSDPETAA